LIAYPVWLACVYVAYRLLMRDLLYSPAAVFRSLSSLRRFSPET